MAKENNKATKTQAQRVERDELRTRRVEARRDMIKNVPSILESSAKVIDSIAAAQKSHIDGCADRYAEVVLAEHAAGVSFLNRLLSIAEETGVVTAVAGAVKAACAASEADSREDQRRSNSVTYETVVCRPWTRYEPVADEPVADEPEPEPQPEPKRRRKHNRGKKAQEELAKLKS